MKKLNLVLLVIFLLLNWCLSFIQDTCTKQMVWDLRLSWNPVIALAWASVMYYLTAFLMDRHLSV